MPTERVEQHPTSPHSTAPILKVSLILAAVIIAASVFRWTIIEWLTPFIDPIMVLGLGLALLCALVVSLLHFLFRFRKAGLRQAAIPFLVNCATLLIVLFVPFTRITTNLDFRWNYRKRMEVVADVLSGKLDKAGRATGRGEFVQLPPSHRGLSAGGDEIIISRRDGATLVFFFTFRGILDSFSGFVYCPDGAKPVDGDFGGQFIEVQQL